MAGEDDDVIVSLPATDDGVVIKKAEPGGSVIESQSFNEDPVADLKNQFATMTARLSTTEAAHQQTSQQLAETNRRLAAAETEVVSSQLDTVLSGIAAAETEASAAEAAYATAFEAGDGAAMARAQRAMAGAVSRQQRLTEAKEDLEDAAKQQTSRAKRTQEEAPQGRRQPPADPIDAFTAGMTPKSVAWVRAHPEVVSDPKLNARMLAAHNLAVADDVTVESEEYFRRIEEGVKPVVRAQEKKPAADGGRRPSSAAAPAGGAGGALNGGGTEVRLTRGEATSATDGTLVWNYDDPSGQNKFRKGDPIGLAEMARRKHEGMKAGLYDRNAIEA